MENVYDSLQLLNKCKLLSEQIVLENNITLEGIEEVKKVLSVGANVDLDYPIEALNNECKVLGKVVLNVVYLTNQDELGNQVCTSNFDIKINNQEIDTLSKINAKAEVVSTNVSKVMGNQIKVITTLNVEGLAVKNKEVSYLKDTAENIFAQKKEEVVEQFDKFCCESFNELLSAKVNDGVKKILMTNVDYVIKDYTLGKNFVSVEGEIYAKVLYANNQEISELQTITITKEFKQEIEAEGVDKECLIDIFANVKNENVLVELEELENNQTQINVSVTLSVCFNVYKKQQILTIQDVYSTKDILSIHKEESDCYINCDHEILEGKIEGNVVLSDQQARVDKYLCTTNVTNHTSNVYVSDNKMYIEGIVNCNVVYLNDELGSVQSVEIEIPYVIDKKVDLDNDIILEPNVCLYDIDVMVKRGREIYFDAKVKAFINVACKSSVCLVAKTECLGELEKRNNAIEIYFAKAGETFWEIAKNLKIPTEVIASQNPSLVDPLQEDQNIAIYFQKQRG